MVSLRLWGSNLPSLQPSIRMKFAHVESGPPLLRSCYFAHFEQFFVGNIISCRCLRTITDGSRLFTENDAVLWCDAVVDRLHAGSVAGTPMYLPASNRSIVTATGSPRFLLFAFYDPPGDVSR